MLRNRAAFAVGALVAALAVIAPTHAAPKADQIGPEVALAAPKENHSQRLVAWACSESGGS